MSSRNDTPSVKTGPLHGTRVLDISRFIAGPYCAMLLGDMGADVLKLERPGPGEAGRKYEPKVNGRSFYALMSNRNKRSVAVDLRTAEGMALLRDLIAQADVLVENFRPGTLEKMGLGWTEIEKINPRLVLTRISGFGQDGPWAQLPCFDGIAQAVSGLMDLTGPADGPPTLCGTYICDYSSGMFATMGTLAALNARHTTGRGQVVDACLLDSATSFLMSSLAEHKLADRTMTRRGSRDRFATPNNVYRTADDRWVYITCGSNDLFTRFANAIGQPELLQDPRFATLNDRIVRWEDTEALAASWIGAHRVEEVLAAFARWDVPCGKVATIAELFDNPQLRARNQIVEIDDPVAGSIPMQGVPFRLSETPLSIRRPMPEVGEHTDEVLREWLGRAVA